MFTQPQIQTGSDDSTQLPIPLQNFFDQYSQSFSEDDCSYSFGAVHATVIFKQEQREHIIQSQVVQQEERQRMEYNERNRIRLRSIQFEKDLLGKRIKELEYEEQLLARQGYEQRQRQRQELEDIIEINKSLKKIAQIAQRSVENPNNPPILSNNDNPFTTAFRVQLTPTQKQYFSNLQNLTQQQMILALKEFGMKRAPKKQMLFFLQKIKDYSNNKAMMNPYTQDVIKKNS